MRFLMSIRKHCSGRYKSNTIALLSYTMNKEARFRIKFQLLQVNEVLGQEGKQMVFAANKIAKTRGFDLVGFIF